VSSNISAIRLGHGFGLGQLLALILLLLDQQKLLDFPRNAAQWSLGDILVCEDTQTNWIL
jgi:hypothetical protein